MKKIKNILLILCLLSQVLPLSAQWKHEPTPNDTLQSVRVLDKGDLLMSIYAPEAKKVSVMGDIAMHEATRAENGVWFATVPGVKDGIYRYWFVVDGVRVYDPKGALSSETSALLEVNKGGDGFLRHEGCSAWGHGGTLLPIEDVGHHAPFACMDTSRL